MRTNILLLTFCISTIGYSQKVNFSKRVFTCDQIAKANDFDQAIKIDTANKVKLMCSPEGAGKFSEVIRPTSSSSAPYYFKKEHNIVWFQFTAAQSGYLGLRILPQSEHDDYDFLLFKSEGENTLNRIKSKRLKPIRSNLARTKDTGGGITGLRFGHSKTHVGPGPNDAYSAPITVTKGETYYLVLDNVYDGGSGVLIYFDYFQLKTIRGVVKDSNENPVKAEVVAENSRTGERYSATTSDSLTGAFILSVPYGFNPSIAYVVSAYAQNYFFIEKLVEAEHIKYDSTDLLKLFIPTLRKGKKIRLNNINFVGNSPVYLASAQPSLKRLYKVMKKNPSLVIHIEGHTNGCANGIMQAQTLSENRALAVKNYLTARNIEANRMTTEGLNCQFMLYPSNSSSKQQALNRRVEILIKYY
jgi:outer membrane protein OmpA-like peptidoglycan-associated protein